MKIYIVRDKPLPTSPRSAARRRKAKPKPTAKQIRAKKWGNFKTSMKRLAILILIVVVVAVLSLTVALAAVAFF